MRAILVIWSFNRKKWEGGFVNLGIWSRNLANTLNIWWWWVVVDSLDCLSHICASQVKVEICMMRSGERERWQGGSSGLYPVFFNIVTRKVKLCLFDSTEDKQNLHIKSRETTQITCSLKPLEVHVRANLWNILSKWNFAFFVSGNFARKCVLCVLSLTSPTYRIYYLST